jgi:predicted dehydrogenase
MGRRRLRLLSHFFPQFSLAAVDSRDDRRKAVTHEFGCPVFESFADALKDFAPQALIVSTPPTSHSAFLVEALHRGINTFSELDLLDDGYEELLAFEKRGAPVAHLSSTMLYRSENRWIINNHSALGKRKFYTYHVGQYLPDWHPWEKYDAFFVGSAQTNAIREILCIELPWLIKSFGSVTEHRCLWSQTSSLTLPYPDTCHALLRHADGTTGSLVVDCVARSALRELRLDGEEGTIVWKGKLDSLRFLAPSGKDIAPLSGERELEQIGEYADFINETPYLEELRHFFHLITGETTGRIYGYAEHREILHLADKFEREWRGR